MLSGERKQTVGVVGAGTMGRGIVQLFAAAGYTVRCLDTAPGAADAGVRGVSTMFRSLASKGRIDHDAAELACGRISACDTVADMSDCELVIEAIIEDLEAKRSLFVQLESVVSDTATLATNTSSLMVSEIASACAQPGRVVGLHFFNPVPLMRIAEVIPGLRTAPEIVAKLVAMVTTTGHRAVVAADQPGFLVNHAGRGLYTEGLRILEEQVCDVADVDRILREAAGFRMGPFELLDLTGLDVSGRVMTSIYDQFQQEPRFRPSSLVPPRIAAGILGRKTSQGWYDYVDGKRVDAIGTEQPLLPAGLTVWIDPDASDFEALRSLVTAAGAEVVETAEADTLCVVQPWGIDATSEALDRGINPAQCVAIDPLPGLDRHRTLMLTAATEVRFRDMAHALFASDGTGVTVINDSPGFVTQRVLAVIVNIATNIVARGIASPVDLEDAVCLGLGYPRGPLAWGDLIGADRVLDILRGLERVTRDPRYRPTPWLVRRAGMGRSLLSEEARRHG